MTLDREGHAAGSRTTGAVYAVDGGYRASTP